MHSPTASPAPTSSPRSTAAALDVSAASSAYDHCRVEPSSPSHTTAVASGLAARPSVHRVRGEVHAAHRPRSASTAGLPTCPSRCRTGAPSRCRCRRRPPPRTAADPRAQVVATRVEVRRAERAHERAAGATAQPARGWASTRTTSTRAHRAQPTSAADRRHVPVARAAHRVRAAPRHRAGAARQR